MDKNKVTYYRYFNEREDLEKVLSLNLRQIDNDELRACSKYSSMHYIISEALGASDYVWVLIHKGNIEAVFGVATGIDGVGVPWFVATDKFKEFKFTFIKEAKKFVNDILLSDYPYLTNFIDSRNVESIKWLEWMGFTVDREDTIILKGKYLFYRFYKTRTNE